MDNIPVDEVKELPPLYMYVVGSLLEFGTLALFVYLAYTGFISGKNQKFMSLESSAGDCTTVQTPMTGEYLIDRKGLWETSPHFSYTEAMYKFVFTDFIGDRNQFTQMLNDSFTQLQFYGHLHAANNDLAYNLVLWAFFNSRVLSPNGVEQKLVLTGQTSIIFNREYLYGLLSNQNGNCQTLSVTTFDPATYILGLQYDHDTFMTDPTCNTTVSPQYLGYSPTIDNGRFHMAVDVRTFMLALSINLGVVLLQNLNLVNGNFR